MISAVDTNVLLDILIPNTRHLDHSLACLGQAVEDGPIIISEIVYAELSSQFLNVDDLRQFLTETMIELRVSDEHVLWEAGRAWKEYTRRRATETLCAICGKPIQAFCIHCQNAIHVKWHIISDFLIGAHARIFAERLITRDRGFYRRYFKGLTICDPTRKIYSR